MDVEQIPVPDNSGASNKQTQGTSNSELVADKPFEGIPMVHAVNGLAASHSKSFGGTVGATLFAGMTQQMSNEHQELKFKFEELSEKHEKRRDVIEELKIENAVLKGIINSDRQNKHFRNFAITMGTGLIGTGIYLSKSQLDNYAWGAYAIGVIFVSLGWFTGPKEVK